MTAKLCHIHPKPKIQLSHTKSEFLRTTNITKMSKMHGSEVVLACGAKLIAEKLYLLASWYFFIECG